MRLNLLKMSLCFSCVLILVIGGLYASEMDDAANDIQSGRYSEALAKLRPAVEAGDTRAMYNLGVMYRDSLGVQRDRVKAKALFLSAAEKGHALAQYAIARLFYEDSNFTEAARWYRKAADQGDIEALYNLGYMYHEGQGVPKDYQKGNELFEEVADRGRFIEDGSRSYKAMDMLGNSYRSGETGPPDYVEAYKWYAMAAARGHPKALGQMHEAQQHLTNEQLTEAKRRVTEFANRPHP
jgi:TPR repeat protein